MSKKCKAYSESKLGMEPPDNRKAFYAGWDAAMLERQPLADGQLFDLAADYYEGYGFKALEFARAIERAHGIGAANG